MTFAEAVELANEIEGASTLAKKKFYHSIFETIHAVQFKPGQTEREKKKNPFKKKFVSKKRFDANKTFKQGNSNAAKLYIYYRCGSALSENYPEVNVSQKSI